MQTKNDTMGDLGGSAPPLVSLRGLVDCHSLESVLNSLLTRMQQQEARIGELESEVQARAEESNRAMCAIQDEADQQKRRLEAKIQDLEDRVVQLDTQAAEIPRNGLKIQDIFSSLQEKIDADAFEAYKQDADDALATAFQRLDDDKADSRQLDKLETAQRHLAQQLTAMQSTVACKMDKAELPLLEAVSDKIQALMNFREAASLAIEQLQEEAGEARALLDSKEDKQQMVHRMQMIHQLLESKADTEWVCKELLEPLEAAQLQLERCAHNENTLTDVVEEQAQLDVRLTSSEEKLVELKLQADSTLGTCKQLKQEVDKRVTLKDLERCRRHDFHESKRLVEEANDSLSQQALVQQAYIQDLRQQAKDLKHAHVHVQKKLEIPLRFVKWYSDMNV